MKKILTFISLILILNLDVKGQIFYNKYTKYNPYYGNSQTYTHQTDDDNRDRRFELGIIVLGVGLVTILASTYDYTSYSYSYYSYSFTKQTNMPMFYTGLGLTATGLSISLLNNKKKRIKDKDIFYE